jgi:tRNA pseudouridine65 synthase
MSGSTPLVTAAAGPLDVLYRDDALVIVNKPSGLSAHRGLANERGDYVLTRVRDAVGMPVYLVHRLDRGTSGAIALVLDPRLVEPLQRAFQEGRVDKRYLALARGVLPPLVSVDYAIPRSDEARGPSARKRSPQAADERVSAQTDFTSRGVFENRYTLVEAHPLTGRYHQIRRHLKHLQHPIIGDTTYGDNKQNKIFRARFGIVRLALHASRLTIPHPVSGVPVEVSAPLLPDLAVPLCAMGFAVGPKSGELGD